MVDYFYKNDNNFNDDADEFGAMKLEDFISRDIADGQPWARPISRRHSIAIFATVIIAAALALVMPNDRVSSGFLTASTVATQETFFEGGAVVPSEPVMAYYDNTAGSATEALDNFDDEISETDLADSDSAMDMQLRSLAKGLESGAAFASKWLVESVEKGDTLSSVFSDLNIPYATMQAITQDIRKAGLNTLTPGSSLSFLLDEHNNLIAFVKQIDDKEQVRIYRKDLSRMDFIMVREPINHHLEAGITEAIIAATAPDRKAVETVPAEEEKKLSAQQSRGKLVVVTINKGESLSSAAYNAGLSYAEIAQISQMFKGRVQFSRHVQPGDTMRVLFSEARGKGRINAVELNLAKLGKLATYRHLGDNKYYDENGMNITASTFRRFPLNGKVRISSHFNPRRRHPITGITRPHNGTDFAVRVGTPVYAPADGVVDKAAYTKSTGYYIVIRHRGDYSTVYMHLSKLNVRAGQRVKLGTMIARSGNTGLSTGPHLHYELRINGRPVNAMRVNLPKTNNGVSPKQKQRFVANVQQYKKDLYNNSLSAMN